MKLTPHAQTFVYELLALGARPCVILKKVNKRYDPKNGSFKSNNLAFYQKKWLALSPDERKQHLPYTMEDSFAAQDVRINDDIKQLELINHRIYLEENEEKPNNQTIVELQGMGVRLKNRIAQELGQARAFTKGGVGNINQLNQLQIQFNMLINEGSRKSPEEQVKYLQNLFKLGKVVDTDKSDKQ